MPEPYIIVHDDRLRGLLAARSGVDIIRTGARNPTISVARRMRAAAAGGFNAFTEFGALYSA